MKVVLDARAAAGEITGVGRYIIDLARGLDRSGAEVVLIYDREPLSKVEGVRSIVLSGKSRFIWEQAVLLGFLRSEEPDLYHATWNYGIPIFYGGNTILTLHDLIPLAWPRYFMSRKLREFPTYFFSQVISLIKASKITTDSESTRRDLQRIFPFAAGKATTVPLGVDPPPSFSSLEQRRLLTKMGLSRPYFIYLGGVDRRKNIDGLIKSFAGSEAKKSCDLIVLGKSADYFAPLAGSCGVSDKVRFLGYVSEKNKYLLLRGALALVYPSFYEGFGFPVLEAMSVGTPVITSNTSALPESVGNAAITINPRNIVELTAAIDKVNSDKNLQESLRLAGHEQVKKFYWDKTIQQTIVMYREVISSD